MPSVISICRIVLITPVWLEAFPLCMRLMTTSIGLLRMAETDPPVPPAIKVTHAGADFFVVPACFGRCGVHV